MANTIDSLALQLDALTKEMKSMSKLLRKVRQHQEDPTGEKAKERAANSGFNRPQRVSEALSKFLGLGAGEGISRGEVTKRINAYVSANNLKNPENKRVILLDEKLKSILDVPADKSLGFTNLQTYLKPHYLGPLDEPAPAAAPDVEVKQEPAAPTPTKKVVKKVVKKPAA
jgi:chromatin remodeling complex protein RSC6